MTLLDSQSDIETPGGLLVLADNGTILRAPVFFRRALHLEHRDDAPSIFHLFDPADTPHLVLHRIFRHPYGSTEYHLRVEGLFGTRHGFRYWPLNSDQENTGEDAVFFIVDDSALIQSHDWDFRRLRREILADVKNSLSSHFKNRLTTLQLLAETLRDAPEIAAQSAPRIIGAVNELNSAINRVITGISDIASPSEYQDSPIRLTDLTGVIETWGTPKVSVSSSLNDIDPSTLIAASSIERILIPVVENAVDASPSGSSVEVLIGEVDDRFAHFEVIDKGVGMNGRVKERAEDPFFTTQSGKLGLGLSHARDALRDAGGEWKIESSNREGTRVTLLIPVTTAAKLFR